MDLATVFLLLNQDCFYDLGEVHLSPAWKTMYMYHTLDDLYYPLTSLISLYTLHCSYGVF